MTTPPLSPAAQADGLHGKYIIHKAADGQPVGYPCFVLRIDGTDRAAIAAIEAYAVATRNWELKTDLFALAAVLQQRVSQMDRGSESSLADWIEQRQIDNYAVVIPDVAEIIGWLRAEAAAAEAK